MIGRWILAFDNVGQEDVLCELIDTWAECSIIRGAIHYLAVRTDNAQLVVLLRYTRGGKAQYIRCRAPENNPAPEQKAKRSTIRPLSRYGPPTIPSKRRTTCIRRSSR